jgi:hypothetical protein
MGAVTTEKTIGEAYLRFAHAETETRNSALRKAHSQTVGLNAETRMGRY